MSNIPKISFGIIVLNNEPFTRYLLRQIYPFAHQIIVVEGATRFSTHASAPDGHSRDGTLEILREFQKSEDPDNKLEIVTAEDEGRPNGFWPGEKDEMSRAYAKRITGNWLWQVDGDEFYLEKDIEKICGMLSEEPDITAISFPAKTFWGSPEFWTDGLFVRGNLTGGQWHRLFRWGNGYRYVSHRLPTVVNERGINLREIEWLDRYQTAKLGIEMFHYSLLFPNQVMERAEYYVNRKDPGREEDIAWAEDCWFKLSDPFHVHNVKEYPAWLERYNGPHPEQIEKMWKDIQTGVIKAETRDMSDVEELMKSPFFRFARAILRLWPPHELVDEKVRGATRVQMFFIWLADWFSRMWRRKSRRPRYARVAMRGKQRTDDRGQESGGSEAQNQKY